MSLLPLPRVAPNFDAVAGSGSLRSLVGALLMYSLVISVLMLIVCALLWALASAGGSWSNAARAKTGTCVALGGAALTGAAMAWANWLLHVGSRL